MTSLPQGAFAVCKIREQKSKQSQRPEKHGKGSFSSYFNEFNILGNLPGKYNEKFMNAIWGHYNRYSPHNIKSNDGAFPVTEKL